MNEEYKDLPLDAKPPREQSFGEFMTKVLTRRDPKGSELPKDNTLSNSFFCGRGIEVQDTPTSLEAGPAKKEAVNSPEHYGGEENPYEVIKVIKAWGLGFSLGNAVKYIGRAGKKDSAKEIEDLEKAIWYIQDRIKDLKG